MSILNPSTFLELTQRLSQECQLPGTGPTTALGAEGQSFDLFTWISQASKEIDELHEDWGYLQVSPGISLATIAGQQIYSPSACGITAGDVSLWKRDTFRNYHTATGFSSEIEMTNIDYESWLRTEQIGVLRTTQVRPMVFAITPNKSLALQCPLVGYTVIGDYYRIPFVLEADADVPLIPQRYRMVIVYKAMMTYGAEQNAAEVYNEAEQKYNKMLSAMRRTQLPSVSALGALA